MQNAKMTTEGLVPKGDKKQAEADRLKRENLVCAALHAFPAPPLHPYAEASERYQRLFKGRENDEIQGMLTARLAIVMRRWRKHADDQFKRRGQSLVRWQTLFELAINQQGETLTSIATRVGVVGPALVGILDELERDGLIERTVDEKDRRSKLIELTPAGEQVIASMFEFEAKLRADFLRGVGKGGMLLMLEAIGIMNENLRDMENSDWAV
jgi:MarR family transcriptional regulator for hemolysin